MSNILEKYLKIKKSGHFKKKVKDAYLKSLKETCSRPLLDNTKQSELVKEEKIVFNEACSFQLKQEHNEIENETNRNHWLVEIEDNDFFKVENEELKNIAFCEELREWSNRHNITHTALKSLITIINKRNPGTIGVRDPRTFLMTPQTITLVQIGDSGQYWHQGFEFCIQQAVAREIKKPMTISINVNMDGLPTFKSSKTEFWPILFNIYEFPEFRPMVIGVFCGKSKPSDLSAFLNPFVEELSEVLKNGIIVNGFKVTVRIRCIICDSPARAFIKGVANFNGQYGCLKCVTVGEYSYLSHTNYYTRAICAKRTNSLFRERKYGQHHKENSPLLQLPIDMIQDFPIGDSLHLIDLGVMKRCLIGWKDGNLGSYRTKWSAATTSAISTFLLQCKMPKEIHRAVRGLDCLSYWKGLEYRTFFLYIGIVILKRHLPLDAYQHFLMLFCAVTICSSEKYKSGLDLAHSLLINYVEYYGDLYGEEYITSNIHNLSHLVDDVKRYGILSTFSSYPFESKLFQIKNLLRTGNNPLVQVAKRITELSKTENKNVVNNSNITDFNYFLLKNEIREVDINIYEKYANFNIKVYSQIHLKDFLLNTDMANKWFLTNKNEIVCVKSVVSQNGMTSIYGCRLQRIHHYFDAPIRSTYINIYVSDCEQNSPSIFAIKDIKCKLVPIQENENRVVFIPLIHTL